MKLRVFIFHHFCRDFPNHIFRPQEILRILSNEVQLLHGPFLVVLMFGQTFIRSKKLISSFIVIKYHSYLLLLHPNLL